MYPWKVDDYRECSGLLEGSWARFAIRGLQIQIPRLAQTKDNSRQGFRDGGLEFGALGLSGFMDERPPKPYTLNPK